MDWVRVLAYITGTVDQELLLRNEYLTAENRMLKARRNRRALLHPAICCQTLLTLIYVMEIMPVAGEYDGQDLP